MSAGYVMRWWTLTVHGFIKCVSMDKQTLYHYFDIFTLLTSLTGYIPHWVLIWRTRLGQFSFSIIVSLVEITYTYVSPG
jgi:hypothetical protein